MVSVQAVAGSIINKAMRGFLEDMTVDPNGLLEEYWAASMFWDYTEMEWENGPLFEGGVMKRSAIPKPAFYIKRGEMERDLALSTKRRERRERKKKTSRKAEASEWDIEAAWVEFINDNGPYELLPGHGIQGAAAVVQRSGLRPQAYSRQRVGISQSAGLESARPPEQLASVPEKQCSSAEQCLRSETSNT